MNGWKHDPLLKCLRFGLVLFLFSLPYIAHAEFDKEVYSIEQRMRIMANYCEHIIDIDFTPKKKYPMEK